MAEGGTFTFNDPDGYAAAFGDTRVKLIITGAGNFAARLTRLNLQHLELYRCRENLPRIAYISLPPERIILSFPTGIAPATFDGFALRNGSIVVHSRSERLHQRANCAFEWGLISVSAKQLADCGEALIGRPITSPHLSKVLRPGRSEALRFQQLLREACRLAETGLKLIGRPEVAKALEQKLLHAIVHCLAVDDKVEELTKARRQHAAVMVRLEEALTKHSNQTLHMSALCAEVGVPERTLRMCCAEILGVSPTRYILLQRLNRARAALRRANPAIGSVAEVARNHHFVELGRFAVIYRTLFGESPSTTLHGSRKDKSSESA